MCIQRGVTRKEREEEEEEEEDDEGVVLAELKKASSIQD